jgi:hypothetical protein
MTSSLYEFQSTLNKKKKTNMFVVKRNGQSEPGMPYLLPFIALISFLSHLSLLISKIAFQ